MENTTRFVAFLGSLHNPPIRGGDLRGDYTLGVGVHAAAPR